MSISIGDTAPTHPYVIRFEDARHIGGYFDIEYLTEVEALKGFRNIQRKKSKTNAVLYLAGKGAPVGQGVSAWWGKGNKVYWL